MKRASLLLLVTSLILAACQPATRSPSPGPSGPPTASDTTAAGTPAPLESERLTIGVEYALLGTADTYAGAGVSYAKAQNVFAVWGNIEPTRGKYQWGPIDALVAEYQKAGFAGFQLDLSALSPWASRVQPKLGNPGDAFPKDEYLDDYAKFVGAVVERYDHDGVGDMPGLRYPVRDYGIEREFTGFWPGTADEYLRLLKTAYPAVKAADPQAQVLLVALLMADVFDGSPTAAQIDQRLAKTPTYMRKSASDIERILAACSSYDVVDFHSLGDYTEIPSTAAWIRARLAKDGCGDKPIWIGDAFPMSYLVGFGGFVPPIPFAPATAATRDDVVATLTSVADPAAADHASAQAWLYAETSRCLVKKLVVSAGAGMAGINIGNMEDWKTGVSGVDKAAVPALGASMFMGLTDTTVTASRPGGNLAYTGQDWSRARRAGSPRPGFLALQMSVSKIGSYTAVAKLDLGAGVWAYRFDTSGGPVWVLWYDDGGLYLPGRTPPSKAVALPFDASRALVTATPTASGTARPATETVCCLGRLAAADADFDSGIRPGAGLDRRRGARGQSHATTPSRNRRPCRGGRMRQRRCPATPGATSPGGDRVSGRVPNRLHGPLRPRDGSGGPHPGQLAEPLRGGLDDDVRHGRCDWRASGRVHQLERFAGDGRPGAEDRRHCLRPRTALRPQTPGGPGFRARRGRRQGRGHGCLGGPGGPEQGRASRRRGRQPVQARATSPWASRSTGCSRATRPASTPSSAGTARCTTRSRRPLPRRWSSPSSSSR